MQFVDKCIIEFAAGNGGNGIVSWRRESHYPEGGPYGGDGGDGGDIYIVGDHNQKTLLNLRYTKKIKAENGENGGTKLCHGANGEDVYVKVPVGTVIKNVDTNKTIVDILKHDQTFLICKGGKGGRGNAYFKSSFNKAPTLFENGDLGQKVKVELELKYLADVGLVGFPNAGKSTFINQISNAKSKIGNYRFTTLTPVLGHVNHNNESLVFADIPGIIEGASEGIGLGFEFLKHIERCHFLIHMISLDDVDNQNIIEAYETINNELKKYKSNLLDKKIYIVANKNDTPSAKQNIQLLKNHLLKNKIYIVSALNNENINELLDDIFYEYIQFKEKWEKEKDEKISSYKLIKVSKEPAGEINIVKLDEHLWEVSSKRIEYWFNKIPQTTSDNLTRFNQKIKIDEIEELLKQKGAKKNDVFLICNVEYVID